MRRLLMIGISLVVLLTSATVFAQSGYPVGYEMVYTAPAADMHPLNYTCTLTAYDVSSGSLIANVVTAEVDAYIVWRIPNRAPEYYIAFVENGIRYWTIYSQQTLDAICKAP